MTYPGDYHRLDRRSEPSLRNWEPPKAPAAQRMKHNAIVDMGWGRLLFGQTFDSNQAIVDALLEEAPDRRDIAFYLRDPHVVLSLAPHRLFLDPSHTYRLYAHDYRAAGHPRPADAADRRHGSRRDSDSAGARGSAGFVGSPGFFIRRIKTRADAQHINRIYASRNMVTPQVNFLLDKRATRLRTYFIAQDAQRGDVLGTVTGVDHVQAFNDPENGASLWCLAVDPQCHVPGVGEGLVRHMVEHYFTRGRQYVDLSVMHDNRQAIVLYDKLGFVRVPVYCVKNKNPINERLFTAPAPPPEEALNPYARIIIDEARRRGIVVEVLDEKAGYFRLTMGGRSIVCRESLTELTHAIAMSRCDDKRVTHRLLTEAGITMPAMMSLSGDDNAWGSGEKDGRRVDTAALAGSPGVKFLQDHGSLVVKPARGEQGAGISVDVRTADELACAIDAARRVSCDVLLEAMIEGTDLRVVIIDFKAAAAAVRRPPVITGTGRHRIDKLIDKYNRRRKAATGGESKVPLDEATHRAVERAGYAMDAVLPAGENLTLRKTANLHTGGTIHDVTAKLHPALAQASIDAARAIDIPVAGIDLIVPEVEGPEYHLIEVNERVGLANHEPQPTAERFVDFLFPASRSREL